MIRANSTSAVPRSCWKTTSSATRPATGTIGREDQAGVSELLAALRVQVGHPQDERELGELRRLEPEASGEREPVAVAVDLDADARDERRQDHQDRDDQERQDQLAQDAQGDVSRDVGADETDDGEDQLAFDDRERVAVVVEAGVDRAGAEHHDQAEPQQQSRSAEHQLVGRQWAIPGRGAPGSLSVLMLDPNLSRGKTRQDWSRNLSTAEAKASPRAE